MLIAIQGYAVMDISNYNTSQGTVAGYKPAEYASLALIVLWSLSPYASLSP